MLAITDTTSKLRDRNHNFDLSLNFLYTKSLCSVNHMR